MIKAIDCQEPTHISNVKILFEVYMHYAYDCDVSQRVNIKITLIRLFLKIISWKKKGHLWR